MFTEIDPLFTPQPFWFANSELLMQLRSAELDTLAQLLAEHLNLRNLFDSADAPISERRACFELLVHGELVQIIDEAFIASYEPSPPLNDVEVSTLRRIHKLVAADAPSWVIETQQIVGCMSTHLNDSLPETLRAGGYRHDNPEQNRLIVSEVETFSSFEKVQALIKRVIDQQLQRLVKRWSAAVVHVHGSEKRETNKRKGWRTRDRQKLDRDKQISEIDDAAQTNGEFLQLMDERKVRPQPTWSGWPGSWREAYKNPRLRKLIHQDKSRALARVQLKRNK